jgi:hypothetical protein
MTILKMKKPRSGGLDRAEVIAKAPLAKDI